MQIIKGNKVISFLGVARINIVPVHSGERSFELENLVCGSLGIGVRPTRKCKHLGDVRNVGIANLGVLFFAVVSLIWQTDSAVVKIYEVAVWIARVVVYV